MKRVTEAQLKAVVERINTATNSPKDAYSRSENKFAANVGNYHLSHAYGGVCLHRMANDNGGVYDVFRSGHVTKRELFNQMHAFLTGIEAANGN
jgi:hypothetical protein